MRCVDELTQSDLQGKKVLLRSDFNMPLAANGEVAEPFRLKRGWETVQFLVERGARVIIISHIGRDPSETIAPVARALAHFAPAHYIADLLGPAATHAVAAMKAGDILLLENVRRDPREILNDEGFARELAELADIYVDDAFAAAHRAHASIVGIPKHLPSYAGLLMRDEVKELTAALSPEAPSFAILGGAKFETKAPLVKTLLAAYDHLFIAGALANDVFKARGLPVGRSLISEELPGPDVLNHPHFVSPVDVVVERSDMQAHVKKPEDVEPEDKIVDIGPDSVALIAPLIREARFILWNGPTGLYEGGYTEWTERIAEIIAESDAKKVIGGGDTIAAIQNAGIPPEKLGFLSTGGGAMLEFLMSEGRLPGIDALDRT